METTITDTNIAVGDHRDLLDIIDSSARRESATMSTYPKSSSAETSLRGRAPSSRPSPACRSPPRTVSAPRFVTELVLRRGREMSTKVSITPGESRFGEDKERLESWQPKASIDNEGLGAVTDEAKRAMADPTGTGEFYEDILRIELTGPSQPHLTMVDLPGLFRRGEQRAV